MYEGASEYLVHTIIAMNFDSLCFLYFVLENIFNMINFLHTELHHWPTHMGLVVIAIRGKSCQICTNVRTRAHTHQKTKGNKNRQKDVEKEKIKWGGNLHCKRQLGAPASRALPALLAQ